MTITATTQTIAQWNAFATANGLNTGIDSMAAYIRLTAGVSKTQTQERLANAARLVQVEINAYCVANGIEIPTPAHGAGYAIYIDGKLA